MSVGEKWTVKRKTMTRSLFEHILPHILNPLQWPKLIIPFILDLGELASLISVWCVY